jgi:hypothetical protein
VLPSFRLHASEARTFDPVGEMLAHQSLFRCFIILSAQRHLVQEAHNARAIKRYAENAGVIAGQNEVGNNPVRRPSERDEIAGACLDRNARVDCSYFGTALYCLERSATAITTPRRCRQTDHVPPSPDATFSADMTSSSTEES